MTEQEYGDLMQLFESVRDEIRGSLSLGGLQAALLGRTKVNGAKARSSGKINLPLSQAALSYRVAVATNAHLTSAWRTRIMRVSCRQAVSY